MELVKAYLDLDSKKENSVFLSMHLTSGSCSHSSKVINTWEESSPPIYVMGSTMPVGFSRNTENHESNRIQGLGTRYEDQRANETKEEYEIRKKKRLKRFNVDLAVIYFLTLVVLTKLAITILSAL